MGVDSIFIQQKDPVRKQLYPSRLISFLHGGVSSCAACSPLILLDLLSLSFAVR